MKNLNTIFYYTIGCLFVVSCSQNNEQKEKYDQAVGQTINVGPDEDVITIEQLSEKILKVLNSDLKPIYVDPRPKEVAFAHCSADKARDILDYETSVSLDKSIEKIANWILSVGPKKFRYHLDIEIVNELTPKTWKERLF